MSLLLDALKRAEAARHDTAPVLSLATDLPVAAPNDLPLPPLAEAQHSNDAQLTEARPVSLELTLAPLSEPLAAPSTAPVSFAAGVTSTPAFSLTPVAAAETPKAVPSRPAEAEPLPPRPAPAAETRTIPPLSPIPPLSSVPPVPPVGSPSSSDTRWVAQQVLAAHPRHGQFAVSPRMAWLLGGLGVSVVLASAGWLWLGDTPPLPPLPVAAVSPAAAPAVAGTANPTAVPPAPPAEGSATAAATASPPPTAADPVLAAVLEKSAAKPTGTAKPSPLDGTAIAQAEQALPRPVVTSGKPRVALPPPSSRHADTGALQSPDAGLVTAWHALSQGAYGEALTAYRGFLAREPANIDGWLGSAAALQALGQHAEAERQIRHALTLDPAHPAARAALTATQAARTQRTKAAEQVPTNPAAQALAAGSDAASAGQWQAAQEHFAAASAADPSNPDAAFNLAISQEHLGAKQEAIQAYRRAAALSAQRAGGFDRRELESRLRQLESQP